MTRHVPEHLSFRQGVAKASAGAEKIVPMMLAQSGSVDVYHPRLKYLAGQCYSASSGGSKVLPGWV